MAAYYLIRVAKDSDGYTHVGIARNGITIAHGCGSTLQSAVLAARSSMYSSGLPFRRGADLMWLQRYLARHETDAPSLHKV